MEDYNQISADFILLGFFPPSRIGLYLLILIVLIFLTALIGNVSMILPLLILDTHLHTPMYILLSQLFLIDLNYISTIVPKMFSDFLFGNKSICFTGGGIQSFFFFTLAGAEYSIHMSKRRYDDKPYLHLCSRFIYAPHPCCSARAINHFFCDVPAMVTLACMDTWVYEGTVFLSTAIFLVFPFIGIACSYGRVLLAVYRMHSAEGRKKAYVTCSSHLTVVTFYYAPFVYTYLCPRPLRSPTEDKVLAEVMGALTRVSQRNFSTKM
uniref:G-protein coupled receptors family 1 profile domain-containing protein n=1 Tax=Aotus nancymaae TaxID=37293 RepID=A0A2K5D2N0_AOTNA